MYEFACDLVIPGCFHKETAKTMEEAREKARRHLEDHHGWEKIEDRQVIQIDAAIGVHR